LEPIDTRRTARCQGDPSENDDEDEDGDEDDDDDDDDDG